MDHVLAHTEMQARETEAAVKNTHHGTAGKRSSKALQINRAQPQEITKGGGNKQGEGTLMLERCKEDFPQAFEDYCEII